MSGASEQNPSVPESDAHSLVRKETSEPAAAVTDAVVAKETTAGASTTFKLWTIFLETRQATSLEQALPLLKALNAELESVLEDEKLPRETKRALRHRRKDTWRMLDTIAATKVKESVGWGPAENLESVVLSEIRGWDRNQFAYHYVQLLHARETDALRDPTKLLIELMAQYEALRGHHRWMSIIASLCTLLFVVCGVVGAWDVLRRAGETTNKTVAESYVGDALRTLSPPRASLRAAIDHASSAVSQRHQLHIELQKAIDELDTKPGKLVHGSSKATRERIQKILADDTNKIEKQPQMATLLQSASDSIENQIRVAMEGAPSLAAKYQRGWLYTTYAIVGLGAFALLAWLISSFMQLQREHQLRAQRASDQLARLVVAKIHIGVGNVDKALKLLEPVQLSETLEQQSHNLSQSATA
jgi:hypothetical protein